MFTMNRALDFLKNHVEIAFATSEAHRPHIRIFQIMKMQGHPEATGKAKITPGFNLPARYVIHTVGPIIPDGEPTREQCA